MESFWLNNKKLSCVESVESLYDILGGFPRSNSHHSDFLHPSVFFLFLLQNITSAFLVARMAGLTHLRVLDGHDHCAFLIPDSCDPAEIPAESYGFPSQRWVSHGPRRKNRLSKQSLRRIRGDASCFLGAVGKAPSCAPL